LISLLLSTSQLISLEKSSGLPNGNCRSFPAIFTARMDWLADLWPAMRRSIIIFAFYSLANSLLAGAGTSRKYSARCARKNGSQERELENLAAKQNRLWHEFRSLRVRDRVQGRHLLVRSPVRSRNFKDIAAQVTTHGNAKTLGRTVCVTLI